MKRNDYVAIGNPGLQWPMLLVPKSYEAIRVCRGKKVIFEGVVPEGFSMHLTLGDTVYIRVLGSRWGKRWIKKFGIVLHRGHPAVRFGKAYGKPEQYIRILTLPKVSMGAWCRRRDRVFSVWGTRKQMRKLKAAGIIQW